MATITEDYVSFEIAKLLKEKGFDEPCVSKYCTDGSFDRAFHHYKNSEINKDACNAPTHQMAMKWLRKVHSLHIQINYMHGAYQEYDYVVINTFSGIRWHEPISFSSYEEAVEAACIYSLENLV